MNCPRWQTRVRVIVERILSGPRDEANVAWGRNYATFLARQAACIDAALGVSARRAPRPTATASQRRRIVVEELLAAHPRLKRATLGKILGIDERAAGRWIAAVGKPRPKGRPRL